MNKPTVKPRVCFVAPQVYPILSGSGDIKFAGGAEVQQVFIAKSLAAAGYEVSAVCLDYGQEDQVAIDGIRVYKTHTRNEGVRVVRFIHPRATSFWRAMKKADAHIYYQRCAAVHTGIAALFCGWYQRKFVYAASSNSDFQPDKLRIKYRRDKMLYEYGLKRADAVISQNTEQQESLRNNYGLDSKLIPNIYKPNTPGPGGVECDILWVGMIRPVKRPELFIKIAEQTPEFRFKMIGGPYMTPESKEYYERIREMAGRVDNLEFAGFMPFDDVERQFDCAKLSVNTSIIEGFPNTFLQSWARGAPTVSFFDPKIHQDGKSVGVIVDSEQEAIENIRALMRDEDKRSRMGERCKLYYTTHHSPDKIAAEYIKLFNSLAP